MLDVPVIQVSLQSAHDAQRLSAEQIIGALKEHEADLTAPIYAACMVSVTPASTNGKRNFPLRSSQPGFGSEKL
jgi:hypothetical protein